MSNYDNDYTDDMYDRYMHTGEAAGANLQPKELNQTQTCTFVYAVKIKPKLNQCKRFVLCRSTEQSILTN